MRHRKKTFILKDKAWESICRDLTDSTGLPEVGSSLGIYFDYDNKNYEVKFYNSDCSFKSYNDNSNLDKSVNTLFSDSPLIHIDNRNIKFFLKALHDLGLNNAYISGKVTNIKFKLGYDDYIDINLGTPVGDLIVFRTVDSEKFLNKNLVEKELDSFDLEREFKRATKLESVFSGLGTLNRKIINYADEFGIDLASSGRSSIEGRLLAKSNNYTDYEKIYEKIIGTTINFDYKDRDRLKKFFKPVSIIIPSFNSEKTLVEVLKSIESQDLESEQKKMLDVIVIDDGSISLTANLLKEIELIFKVKIIRLETNNGLSNARNIGTLMAKNEQVIFIDSDILLADNYLLEHSIALQMFPNALFVSMKNNIEDNSKICALEKIQLGLPVPDTYNDKRLIKIFKKGEPWINSIKSDGVHEVLSETDSFKAFGHGRLVGGYDLSSMVVGHNMSTSKRLLSKAGGFSNYFSGWGLEDTFFGSRIISSGGFIIPLLNTGVYHVNHPPRSGDDSIKIKEYENNLKTYKKLMENEE